MFYETGKRDRTKLPHDPFKAIVAPRPIGWISTRALDRRVNLAPYSFFNGFCSVPPIVGFSSEGWKDSASFAKESGEFVDVDRDDLAERQHAAAPCAAARPDLDDLDHLAFERGGALGDARRRDETAFGHREASVGEFVVAARK